MGATISSCVEPGPTFALFEAVRTGDVRRINMWLGLQPELLKYRNLSSGDTVWHVAAVAGNAEVLEALASHAPALEELEVQQRRLQRQKSSRRRREAASAGRVAPRAELAVAAGASAVGSGRGSGSGSSGAGGALSEADRASPSQPASPNAAAASQPDVQRTQSDEQPPQPQLPAQQQADPTPPPQQQQQALPGTPEPAHAARVELLRSVINLRSDKHQTPLMHAANAGRLDVLKWLLQQGADPWAQDRCGLRSALHYAAMRGRVDCVQALLDFMPSTAELRRYLEYRSISGLTPLHYAVSMGQAEVVRLLLQRGADMMAVNLVRAVNLIGDAYDLVQVPKRSTPLHVAAAVPGSGGLQCALVLLQHYHHNLAGPSFPDPRRRVDITGRTPYQVANFYRSQSALISELLHPASNLASMFEREGGAEAAGGGGYAEGASVAAPVLRLKQIAGAAVRRQLLADIEHSERVIQHFRRRHRAAGGLERLSPFACSSTPAASAPDPDPHVGLPGGVDDSGCALERVPHEPAGSSRSGSTCGVGQVPDAACCPPEMQQRVGGCVVAVPAANESDSRTETASDAGSCCEGGKGCGSVKAAAGGCPAGSAAAAAVVLPGGEKVTAQACCSGGGCGGEAASAAGAAATAEGAAAGAASDSSVMVVPCCTLAERQRGACCSAPCVCSSNCRPGPAPQPHASSATGSVAVAAAAPALSRASSKAALSLQRSPSLAGSVSAGTSAPTAAAVLLRPLPGCCTVRQPLNRFASRSLGYEAAGGTGAKALRAGATAARGGAYAKAPLVPVAQCSVCLEDAFCLVSEPCHHRLCATCSRDVTQRATALPLACVVCREPVFQFTSPVC